LVSRQAGDGLDGGGDRAGQQNDSTEHHPLAREAGSPIGLQGRQ
jgi:hypothetical protein